MRINKKGISSLLIWGTCLFFMLLAGCEKKDKQAKHVILISMDTTRADHLGCYGFPKNTTPNIDKFAKDSVLFEQCIAPVPLTLPSHSSMMTGTNPIYHGVHENVTYTLAPENITLAERFKEKGYKTGTVISTFVLDPQFGFNQGFDDYDGKFQSPLEQGVAISDTQRRGDDASRVAIEWLEKNKDEDFFFFLHYYDPHDPYQPPQPFAAQFSDDLYSGEIAFMDFCIGQVFDKLKELKIYDDSLIIIVGDHGEGLGEHDEKLHGYYIYQCSIHVPMIVHFPNGQFRNRRINQTVGLIDLAPTICRWTGIESLPEYAGKDLTDYLEFESVDDRFLYSESLVATKYGSSSLLGLVNGKWKYIQSSEPEMFDLEDDPVEINNIIESESKRARIFQEELKLVLTEQVRVTTSRSGEALDEESRKKLESLGYISGGIIEENFEFETDKDHPREWIQVYKDLSDYHAAKCNGDFIEAEKCCLKVLNNKAFYVNAYYYLAEVQFNLGKYNEAIETAKEFLRRAQEKIEGKSKDKSLNPVEDSLGSAYHIIGMSCHKLNQNEKAIYELNLALKAAAAVDRDKIYINLGNVYLAQGDNDLAIENFNKAIEINPDCYNAYYNLGLVYVHQQDYAKALQSFAKAHELKSDWDLAKQKYEQTKQTIEVREKIKAGIQKLESDLKKDPQNPSLLDKTGGYYQLLGEIPKAVEYWQKSLEISPDNAVVLNNIAFIFSQKNLGFFNPDKALEDAENACRLTNYQNPNYLDTLALVHASRGDFDRAVEVAQQALTLAISENENLAESIQKNLEQYKNRTLP